VVQRDREIPKMVEERVLGYYSYLFLQKKLQLKDDFFDNLPPIFKVDYSYNICSPVFQKVCAANIILCIPYEADRITPLGLVASFLDQATQSCLFDPALCSIRAFSSM